MNRLGKRLDEIDRKIVGFLRHDARRSTASIARALKLSRTAVQARIARLESDGIILGYSAELAPHVDGGISALITISIAVRPCSLVVDQLLSWPVVERVYSIAGDQDAVLVASVASAASLSDLADKLQALPGVRKVQTTVILSEHKARTSALP